MHGFVYSNAAIRTYAPMILGTESFICAATRMNNASRITAATVFTNGRIFTRRIVLFFIGRGTAIDTELPMIVGIRFIIVIIMMLNSAVCNCSHIPCKEMNLYRKQCDSLWWQERRSYYIHANAH